MNERLTKAQYKRLDAKFLGADAFRRGDSMNDNPFRHNVEEKKWIDWNNAYYEAMFQSENATTNEESGE